MRALLLLCAPAMVGAQALDLTQYKVIDLTHPFNEKTIYWPNAPSTFKLQKLFAGKSVGGYFYSAYAYSAPEHGGTHLDAPVHFSERGKSADQIPLTQLMGAAVVIDISAKAKKNTDYLVTADDVRQFEAKHGALKAGTIVLLRTDWSKRWPNKKRYLGDDKPGDASKLHFPSFGADAARLLVERKVNAIGVDVASIDYGPSKDFIVHQIVGGANVPGFENLTNLDQLPATGATIIALPMKIEGGSGGPLRVIALVKR